MKPIYLTAAIVFCAFFTSCKKNDEWKLPADVSVKIDINRSASASGQLVFNSGNITLTKFIFDGDRQQGDDVYFTRPFPGGLSIPFDPNNSPAELDFDIPQGTYNKISISFETPADTGSIGIFAAGAYTEAMTAYPVRFEFRQSQSFSIVAKNNSGNNEIVLSKDLPATVKIKLDPIYWFQIVPTGMFSAGSLVDVDGIPTMLINEDWNTDIYNLIIGRISETAEVVFQ